MKEDTFKNTPWSAYGPDKQAWKEKGNYYTPEELAEMDKVDDFTICYPHPIIMDGN